MVGEGVDEVVRLLRSRSAYLDLLTDGPVSKRDVVEAVTDSRSTVNYAIRQLESAGLVRRTDGGYAVTTLGRLAHDSAMAHRRQLAGLLDTGAALRGIRPATGLDVSAFERGEVVAARPGDRDAPLRHFCDHVESADGLRAVLPDLVDGQVAAFERGLADEGTRAELVFSPPALERFVGTCPDRFGTRVAGGSIRLLELATTVPHGLAICEGDGTMTATYGDAGVRSVVTATDPCAVARIEATYESLREEGRLLGTSSPAET